MTLDQANTLVPGNKVTNQFNEVLTVVKNWGKSTQVELSSIKAKPYNYSLYSK